MNTDNTDNNVDDVDTVAGVDSLRFITVADANKINQEYAAMSIYDNDSSIVERKLRDTRILVVTCIILLLICYVITTIYIIYEYTNKIKI